LLLALPAARPSAVSALSLHDALPICMKRTLLGVVDIGSNTIRSLIVEAYADGAFRTLDDEREVARLAAGLNRKGRLSQAAMRRADRKSTRLNSSHVSISYAVCCLKKK